MESENFFQQSTNTQKNKKTNTNINTNTNTNTNPDRTREPDPKKDTNIEFKTKKSNKKAESKEENRSKHNGSNKNEIYDLFEKFFPIDLVYSWVNGSDPVHKNLLDANIEESKEFYNNYVCKENKKKNCLPVYPSLNRYMENNELRYSIRSVEMYMPWIRNIYIITNSQIPSWLNLDNPRIRLITLEEFYPYPEVLPVFSSTRIENYLHLLPGLSKYFLYMNDDFFLVNPVHISDFIFPNGTYILRRGNYLPESDLKKSKRQNMKCLSNYRDVHTASKKHVDELFDKAYGERRRRFIPHTPQFFNKEILERMHEKFYREYEKDRYKKFRHNNDMQLFFANSYFIEEELEFDFDHFWANYIDLNKNGAVDRKELWKFRNLLERLENNTTVNFNLNDNFNFGCKADISLKDYVSLSKHGKWSYHQLQNFQKNLHFTKLNLTKQNQFLNKLFSCIDPKYTRGAPLKQDLLKPKCLKSCAYLSNSLSKTFGRIKYSSVIKPQIDIYLGIGPKLNPMDKWFQYLTYKKYTGDLKEKFLCLNDHRNYNLTEDNIVINKHLFSFLHYFYPTPSQFELPTDKINKKLRLDY
ncbi:hypothetical protein M0813_18900 [Anaeramoeba flamelloides]|uniref:Uncharacterized protein n=1 Tax=Anaeramoeba flamelloides TaxID=1746091 RepID=A0ABQ8YRY2_9EUKA|nr:hypothetical protein M0813_18900 [Anaeramoeba flamelloides]